MPLFSINKIDSIIFELKIDGVLKRIISLSEFERVKSDVTHYLEANGISTVINPSTFSLMLEKDEDNVFEHLFLVGRNKLMVPLSKELSFSGSNVVDDESDVGMKHSSDFESGIDAEPVHYDRDFESKPVMYTYSSLNSYVRYWEDSTNFEERQRALFAQLSNELIEVPYADRPKEYEYRFGRVAFHPNHGSAHAIRLVILFNKYLRLIECSELPQAPTISQEEKACLSLAMFLFRSGRTNEMGWSGDTSYSKRSAAIFTHIAKELGHSNDLVDVIAQCFNYQADIHLTTGFYKKSLIDSNVSTFLYQKLFQLAHNSDLVRCHEKYSHLKSALTDTLNTLKMLLNCNSFDADSVDEYLLFAAQCCVATGAPVTVGELHKQTGGSFVGNPYKMVQTSHNIVESLRALSAMSITAATTPSDSATPTDTSTSTDLAASTTNKTSEHLVSDRRFFSKTSSSELTISSVFCPESRPSKFK